MSDAADQWAASMAPHLANVRAALLAGELPELSTLELAEALVGRELTEAEAIVATVVPTLVTAAEGGPPCPLLAALEAAGYAVVPAAELHRLELAAGKLLEALPPHWHAEPELELEEALEEHLAARRRPRGATPPPGH